MGSSACKLALQEAHASIEPPLSRISRARLGQDRRAPSVESMSRRSDCIRDDITAIAVSVAEGVSIR